MASEGTKLRPKGPLTKPILATRSKSSYSEPSSTANGIKLDVRRKGSRKSREAVEGIDHDDLYTSDLLIFRSATIRLLVCSIALFGPKDPRAEGHGGEEGPGLSDSEDVAISVARTYSWALSRHAKLVSKGQEEASD